MASFQELSKSLSHLGSDLLNDIEAGSEIMEIPANTEILREGQYVKVIPIVIEGLLKVFTRFEDRELLLYYIQPNESCVMSFSANMQDQPSLVTAVTETDSTVLAMPVDKVIKWSRKYPNMNVLFFRQFNQRYNDLLNTINHLIYNRLDVRLFDYLKQKSELTGNNPVRMSHKQIAADLGTAREVVSRLAKKLEREGKIVIENQSIKVL